VNARLRLAGRRLQRAIGIQPLLFFEPSPALSAFVHDRGKRIVVRAANRVGKTRHATYKAGKWAVEHPGSRIRVVGPTSKMVNSVHARYLNDFLKNHLREGSYYTEGRGFNAGNTIVLRNGSIIQLMSYEQSPDAHAGDELDIVLLDEPPTQPIFQESLARVLSRDGAVWITLTAVGRPVKWLRQIVEAADSPWKQYVVQFSAASAPWYSAAQVASFLRDMAAAPWQYAQRVMGAWEGVTDDRRLSAFSNGNVVPLTITPAQGWPLKGRDIHAALVVDHGEDAGHSAWLLFAWMVVKRDRYRPTIAVRVLAEWTNPKRMSAEREAVAVREMVERAGLRLQDLDFAVGDINSAGKTSGARSLNEAYESIFAKLMGAPVDQPVLRFRAAQKGGGSIDTGLIVCNQLFGAEIAEDTFALSVHESCERLVEACSHWTGKNDDMKHLIDALRYGTTAIVSETGAEPTRLAA
jgi:hypothetical protein